VQRFIARWRSEVGLDFYPALRLILPDKDRDRGVYGLKENTIGKLLVQLMKIDKNSDDGHSLLHWKLPGQTATSRLAGDFAGRCFEVLSKRQIRAKPGSLRIGDVNELLDRLAAVSGESEQLKILEIFYRGMNAEELQWLIRILLKQLKVGASERTILNLWHPDAETLFSVSSSLRRVCWELFDPALRLEQDHSGITLMECFQPQLAQFQASSSFEKMVQRLKPTADDPEFWIEEKLDGERMQMHLVHDSTAPGGRRFAFWSRKAKDYTTLYGKHLTGSPSALTRYLADVVAPGVRNLILDGEMITWDPKTDKIVAFGTLKTAALNARDKPHDDAAIRPLFRVFDILLLNDQPLTRYTLRDRRRALEQAVRPVHRRLEIHEFTKATDPDAIEPRLREIVSNASEGLVLKNPRSQYRLNSRNDDWVKVKPEYMTEFGESFDCVVVGGYYGSGNRGGMISSFLCGLRACDDNTKDDAIQERHLSFCKVGGGFKVEDYAEIWHHTEGKWAMWNKLAPPSDFVVLAGSSEEPDVWIRPSQSIVISVKASSVEPSSSFAVGETLRFPRFRALRLDRQWDSALNMDQFQEMRHRIDEQIREQKNMSVENRRRPRPLKRKRGSVVVAGHETASVRIVPGEKSQIFGGRCFYVISDAASPFKMTKAKLGALIKEHGGQLVQKSTTRNGCRLPILIADRRVVKVAALMKSRSAEIVRPQWLLDCIQQSNGPSLLPLEMHHFLFARPEARDLASQNADRFGDSFAREVESGVLREILNNIQVTKTESSSNPDSIAAVLDQLEGCRTGLEQVKGLLFRRCHVSLVAGSDISAAKVPRLKTILRFGSGSVTADPSNRSVTHVVIAGADSEGGKALAASVRKAFGSRLKVPRVVRSAWVEESWREGTLLDAERGFLL
jgi:DNA ligase 4